MSDHNGYLLIDDSNSGQFTGSGPWNGGYGLIPRDWNKVKYGSVEFAGPVPLPLIPEAEWKDRIADKTRNKSWLSDIADDAKIPCLNQGKIGYCHCFSPAHAAMELRAVMGQPFVLLSASSVGGPVTGYKNEGAWIIDDLRRAAEFGFADAELYPMLTTKNEWTPEAEESAKRNRISEWWELKRRNFDEVVTCLLSDIPVCVGLNWWGHAVTYLALALKGNDILTLFQNSWGDNYGGMGNGRAYLSRSKATPDEAYAPRQMTPSQPFGA